MNLEQKVKLRCAELNLTLGEVSKRMGYKHQYQLNQMYKSNLRPKTLYKLAHALCTDVRYFVDTE
jgi:hypothetical protein